MKSTDAHLEPAIEIKFQEKAKFATENRPEFLTSVLIAGRGNTSLAVDPY
jgi:hypothetical protein